MANARPEHRTDESPLIASALRTLDTEADGIAALVAAIRGALAAPFAAAVDLIAQSKGRLIVTGMGKSGHVGRKIAATFASTGTPAYFVHPGEASHGDLGMITRDDVIMALSWSGETVELKDLIDYSRRFKAGLIAVTADAESTLAKAADVVLLLPSAREACPHNLAPTTSSLMQLALGDALAVRSAREPRLHGARFPRSASGRPSRREAEVHPRRHAHRQRCAAAPARHRDGGRDRGDDGERFRLRRDHGRRRPSRRHHHRRRSAPSYAHLTCSPCASMT